MPEKSEIKFEQPSTILLLANQYLWMVLALVVVIVLSLGYFFLLSPKIASTLEAKKGADQFSQKEEEVRVLIQKVTDLEYEFNAVQTERTTDLKKLQKIIPKNPEIAELFVLAERLAFNRGLVLQSVDFVQDEAVKTEEASTSDALSAVSINMSVTQIVDPENPSTINPYDLFKLYLNDLESNIRLFDVESVNFSGVDSPDSALSMTFNIKTYFVAE